MEKLKITQAQTRETPYLKIACPNTDNKKFCEKHGYYDATWKNYRGKMIDVEFCPKCRDEEHTEQEKRQASFELRQKISTYQRLSNVPKRFKGLDINKINVSYHKNDEDNRRLKQTVETVKRYLGTYAERLEAGSSGFFSGKCGTGKTMLACMMVENIINQGHSAHYVTAWQMIQEIRQGYKNGINEGVQHFIKQYVEKSFLVIDEIGVQHGTDDERILLYQVIDGRYNEVKPTVLISNSKNPVEDGYLDLRTIDRLKEGGGFSITFNGESYRR